METTAARNLVKDTFENGFDKSRFYYFIKNLLNEIEEEDKDKFIYRGNFIPDAYKPYIKTLERIGKYQDPQRNKIDLLVVQLKKETSLEYARTMQRNFVSWYLNGSRGDVLKDAALVAFVSPDQADWRFSLVRMDYKLGDSGKVKQELTPARRFSFLVGENEASHTAQSRLTPLIEDDKNSPTLDQLESLFNIEKVTKEFFEKYRELFLWVKDELERLLKSDKRIKEDFETKKVNTVDFSKKLLGQIVFLYFLQKKGWFGVQRDEDWGTGPKDFLRRLFEKQIADYDNFFDKILEPLFYEALARERDDNFYSRFDCKIPFLNGGLFDPLNDYDWVHTDINLPDELFSNNLKTKEGDTGTGILDIFDRYNFTVKEDEPLDKEVAVDPEMLGKVFENLLEVKDRKSKGTYYTPREIVNYMCQESLINHLATELKDKVKKKDLKTLIQLGETAVEHDSHISDNGKETPTYTYKLPESIRENAKLIDEKLADIKVCDPAIGSGAFPVGMMNIVVKTRNVLTSYFKDKTSRSTYDFKRHAIANSLYGVDIDLGAVEIAKLRLWLSLIVDEEDIKKIKPLPNLDYKIMQGNSLIELLSPDLVGKGHDREKNELIDKLNELKSQYLEATSRKVKKSLRAQINELIVFIANYDKAKELEQSKNLLANLKAQKSLFSLAPENLTLGDLEPKELKKLQKKVEELEKIKDTLPEDHFEWHLNFNEVFEEKDGFDVIIANPPYLGEKGNKETFRKIRNGSKFGKSYYKRKMDLFYFFIHLALDLGSKNSNIAFITTNYYVTADGALSLRKDLFTRSAIRRLVNFGELRIFDSATGQHNMISIFSKGKDDRVKARTSITDRIGTARASIQEEILNGDDENTSYYNVPQNELFDNAHGFQIRLAGLGSTTPLNSILYKMSEQGVKLGETCHINMGVQSGADYVGRGLLGRAISNNFVSKKHLAEKRIEIGEGIYVVNKDILAGFSDKEISEVVKPFVKNSAIGHYYLPTQFSEYYLYVDSETDINDYPNVKKHLSRFRQILRAREQVKNEEKNWYWLRGSKRKYLGNSDGLILCPYRAKRNYFALTKELIVGAGDVYYITKKTNNNLSLKYILSLLNSKTYYLWFYYRGKRKGRTLELYQKPLSETPITQISPDEQEPFIEIVDKILTTTKSNDYLESLEKQARVREYEKQIDQMVYKLYDLTPEEMEIVEKEAGKN